MCKAVRSLLVVIVVALFVPVIFGRGKLAKKGGPRPKTVEPAQAKENKKIQEATETVAHKS